MGAPSSYRRTGSHVVVSEAGLLLCLVAVLNVRHIVVDVQAASDGVRIRRTSFWRGKDIFMPLGVIAVAETDSLRRNSWKALEAANEKE
ncbi:MAG: hypothetical protein H0V49_01915 [Nocardioidaceae bacterium]|nr:hypothetical protein [Nocardioidaceae bacterium]